MGLAEKYVDILNKMTCDLFETKEVKSFLEMKLNRKRAQIISKQYGLFVRYRRSAWAYCLARAPHMDVKRELLKHENEELLHDPRCGSDHYNLWVVHGKAVGLTEDEVNNATPLPTTRAALNGWIYLAMYRPWYESLGGVSVLERTNMDAVRAGGAHQTRAERRWVEDLGLTGAAAEFSRSSGSRHRPPERYHENAGEIHYFGTAMGRSCGRIRTNPTIIGEYF